MAMSFLLVIGFAIFMWAATAVTGQPQRIETESRQRVSGTVTVEMVSPQQTDSPETLYEIKNVAKTFRKGTDAVRALSGINLSIGGGVTAITGPNGSGKSTLMGMMGALQSPSSGGIWYRGERMEFENDLAMNRFRARIPAWIMQDLNLFEDQSAVNNVAFALTRFGSPNRPSVEAACQQLAAVGIDKKTAKRLPRFLSGGQRQRVAIARALLAHEFGGAEIILADEPTASVDSTDAVIIFQMLVNLSHKTGVPAIIVTHDPKMAEMADRIVRFQDGAIIQNA